MYSCVCATVEQTKIMARNGKYCKYRYKCFWFFGFSFFRIAKLAWAANISRPTHWFPHEMVSDERTQKFYTDNASLPGSG